MHLPSKIWFRLAYVVASVAVIACPSEERPPPPEPPPLATPTELRHISRNLNPTSPIAPSRLGDWGMGEGRIGKVGRSMVADGPILIIADPDHHSLFSLDTATGAVVESRALPGTGPERVVVLPGGDRWLTLRQSGELARIQGRDLLRVPLPLSEPYALAANPAGDMLYVSGVADAKVVAFDLSTRTVVDYVSVERPRALAVVDDELIVVGERSAIRVGLRSDGTFETSPTVENYRERNPWMLSAIPHHAVRASQLAVDPRDGSVLVVHAVATPRNPSEDVGSSGYGASQKASITMFGVPPSPLEGTVSRLQPRATQSEPAVGEIADVAYWLKPHAPVITGSGLPRVVLQLLDQPMDIVHHPTRTVAFVAAQGSDTVVALNTALADPASSPLAVWHVGAAPKGLALSPDGRSLFVLEAHDYSVGVIDLALLDWTSSTAHHAAAASSMVYADRVFAPEVERGRRLFTFGVHQGTSGARVLACASCHFEGREDQLTWEVEGQLRQTPALGGRLEGTEPFNWGGTEAELHGNMVETVRRLGGEGLSKPDLRDLEAFMLRGLRPIPQLRSTGAPSPIEKLGEALFHAPDVGCASCHSGPTTTDGKLHDVGTTELTAQGAGPRGLNTPSLRSLHYTAPYLHDGSAPTLYDVLERTATTMGHSAHLLDFERDALVAYLLTL